MLRMRGSLPALLLFILMMSGTLLAQPTVDFRQAANDDSPYQLGDVHWVNSILQKNNSVYFEGMSVPQRIMFTSVPSARKNQHTLTFKHLASKNMVHAYDFLTSYDQALSSSKAIAGPTTLVNLNNCGAAIGPPHNLGQMCTSLRSNGYSFSTDLPDDMKWVLSDDIAKVVANYENAFGNRELKIYGDQPISSAVVVFNGYSKGRDPYAEYTLHWTSTSSSILLEFAGHLSMAVDVPNVTSGVGYGIGRGAGSIKGAPFHFKLDRLDGSALGSQDNQISSSAIVARLECDITGSDVSCANTQSAFTFNSASKNVTYAWSLENNSSGASIVGSTTGRTVVVDAGSTSGGYTVVATVSDGRQTVQCPYPVIVSDITVTAAPTTAITCSGGSASIVVSATGGSPPYTGTGTFNKQAGSYTFTVTDANGCSGSTTLSLSEPAQLAASANATIISCTTGNAEVTVNAVGGKPPYKGTGKFMRGPGKHNFTVLDDNGCSDIATVTITSAPVMQIGANVTTPVSCNGGNATVTVSASGGTPPYTGVGTFTRSAGTYAFTVSDANGCSGTTSVTVTEPAQLSTSAAIATPISCNGGDAAVTVTATGGTAPYSGTGTFNKPAGTHTFTVTDANGCTSSSSLTITEPAQMAVTASATPLTCGNTTSTVTVTASGGTPPYSGIGTFSKSAGTHTFTVTDANNCSASATVTITGSPSLNVTATASPIGCNGGNSTVTVAASGGTPPYSGVGSFSKPAGTYTFTVTDAQNCSSSATVTITQPSAITATANPTSLIQCYGGQGSIAVSATGGTPPYTGTGTFSKSAGTHTFTVTDANGCTATASATLTQPSSALAASSSATQIQCYGTNATVSVTASGGTPPYTGIGSFAAAAGTHNYTVTDANGCTAVTSITITEPPQLVAGVTATSITCSNTTSTVTVSAAGGTPPYLGIGTYTKAPGTYTFTVTDALGCTDTATITISGPSSLIVSVNASPINCNGSSSTVTVSASGGTPPYTGVGTFSKSAGTHTFTVTDANNCSSSQTVTITQPSQLTASSSASTIQCYGGTAAVTVTASGGTPPYTGTGTFQAQAGTHTYTVTDSLGCTATTSVTVTEPTQLIAGLSATPITCTTTTSTITVSAVGGTPPYSGTGSFTKSPGTYIFTVTDANGCQDTASITITGAPSLIAAASATPINCNGSSSTVTVSASGGTPPYSGVGTFSKTAGTYTFTVTDANNCSASATVNITQPPLLTASSSATNIACYGGTAIVTVAANGGTPPYSGTGSFPAQAGTHTYTVTDSLGCTATTSVTVTEPTELIVGLNATPITCSVTTSTVTVSAVGGTPPYSGTGTFTKSPGTYIFTVTDANGCQDTASITITGAPQLVASAIPTPINCNGDNSTVTVSASGGTPPYVGVGTYTRGAGTYTFTVTDANNCSASTTITITQPPLLTANSSATSIQCYGEDATITVTASGGTPPYTGTGKFYEGAGTYSFMVTDSLGCTATTSITISEPPELTAAINATQIQCNGSGSTVTVTATGGTPPYSGTGTFTRPAGLYSFAVTDANGCSDTVSVNISEPPLLTASSTATPVLCYGDNSTVTVNGAGGTPPYSGTGTFFVTAGTYTYTVTDAFGCTASTTVTITEPTKLMADADAQPILCYGGSTVVDVDAVGGTPPYSGTGSFTRTAGTHSFIVTDANGCADTVGITLTEPTPLIVTASGTPILCNGGTSTITVSASGGTPPYFGTGTFSRGEGTYYFQVTDANGCSDTVSITLTEPPLLTVNITKTPVLCYGDYSTVVVTATGGKPPYTGTGTWNLTAGTYSFTVTDYNNCSATETVIITEPPMLRADATAPDILCYGGTTVVDVDAVGGTPPYQGTGKFTRHAGTHTFVVIDANGCTDTVSITLTEPTPLIATADHTPIACNGGTSIVTVNGSGGTPGYTGTGGFTRGAGTHTFVVTDANGCTAQVSVTITEPPKLVAHGSALPVNCGRDSSTVTVTASGGTPPYQGIGTFKRLPGYHSFTVIDSMGCIATISVLVDGPTPIIIDVDATPILCYGDKSIITVSASGGTAPYSGVGTFQKGPGTYVFTVIDAHGCEDTDTITLVEPPPLNAASTFTPILCHGDNSTVTVTASGGTPPYQGTGTYLRGAGTYSFTVVDSNGCTATTSVTILEPPELVVNASATSVICGKDSATVTITASGGTPPYQGTGTFKRVPGTYTFTVTDDNNCSKTVSVTVNGPPPLVAAAVVGDILCNGGTTSVTVSASGGTPPYSGVGTFTKGAGTYTYVVSDVNNCTDTVTITVTEPAPLIATCKITECINGVRTVSAVVTGGTPPYQYTWNPGNHQVPQFDVPCSYYGTITLVVRDANWNSINPNNSSCQATCSLNVISKAGGRPAEATANDYSLFENYPNPFNPSTTISYFIPERSRVHLSIINTLGRTVKTLVNEEVTYGLHSTVWDGLGDSGETLPAGSYIYRINAQSLISERKYVRERLMLMLK
ncbi:hypothetical protein KQI65_17620 [bacterium]|nr:hypothetical protein [bacterium]